MLALIEATMITSIVYMVGYLLKRTLPLISYLLIFLTILIGALIFGPSLHAKAPDAKTEIRHLMAYLSSIETRLSHEDRQMYREKIRFHQSNGDRCYRDAKNKCMWLPDFDDRENAKFCFANAVTLLAPGAPHYKLIAATVELLIYYGLNVIDEWGYIKNKMHWAEYHYEMMEFYQDVIKNDGY